MDGITCRLQQIGEDQGIVLSAEMIAHLGVGESGLIELRLEPGAIVLTGVHADSADSARPAALRPGPSRQSFEEAMRTTLSEYASALRRLAGAPDAGAGEEE